MKPRRYLVAPRNSSMMRTAMPPKRKIAVTDDNAVTASDSEGASQSQPSAKRVKQTESTSDDAKAPNGQPTNKVLPVNVVFPPRAAGTLRFATWNVCGLAAAQRKVTLSPIRDRVDVKELAFQGFKYYVEAEDPDILVLTETKASGVSLLGSFRVLDAPQVNNEPVDPAISARFPYRTWAISDKKTYGASVRYDARVRPFSTLQGALRCSRKSSPSQLQSFFRDIRTLIRSRGVL